MPSPENELTPPLAHHIQGVWGRNASPNGSATPRRRKAQGNAHCWGSGGLVPLKNQRYRPVNFQKRIRIGHPELRLGKDLQVVYKQ